MNTEIEIKICGVNFNYARSAAEDSFERVGALEDLLSLYKIGGDIPMINTAPVGEVCKLTCYAMDCIIAAFKAAQISSGAVDVCMGEYFLKAKNNPNFPGPKNPRRAKFAIDPDNYLIQKLEEGIIDLGAVGKGYAVDCVAEQLREVWDIKSAFISFGASSIFAFGEDDDAKTWSVSLDDDGNVRVPLQNKSVGASGTAVQGLHILDGRTGEVPANQPYRTWAFCDEAAISDAMSTAFMILDEDSIRKICAEHKMSAAIQLEKSAEIKFIG